MTEEKPHIAGLKSIKLFMQPGIYAYCTCGHSCNQPFCDDTCSSTSFIPLKVKIDEARKVKWCSCKLTHTPPWCDHTHREIPQDNK